MKKVLGIILVLGMLLAGIVTIAETRRENHRRTHERWDRGRERIRQWSAVERYRQFWFNTTFMLELDDETLIRAKDVYSKALHDINQEHQTKDRREIAEEFANNLRKTIGDENFDKLSKSSRRRGKRGGRTGTYKTKKTKN